MNAPIQVQSQSSSLPNQCLDENSPDFDVRDKIIKEFLHTTCMSDRNNWFNLNSYGELPKSEAKVKVTTIAPVPEENLLYRFRHSILNKFIPYETIIKMNTQKPTPKGTERTPFNRELEARKIHEFFDWLDSIGYCSWKEQQPEEYPKPA